MKEKNLANQKSGIPDKSGRFSSMKFTDLEAMLAHSATYQTHVFRITAVQSQTPVCSTNLLEFLKKKIVIKEGNGLFNDTLNTFYLQLYGIRHMVEEHSDSERGNMLPPHRLLFLINSKGSFICTIPQRG